MTAADPNILLSECIATKDEINELTKNLSRGAIVAFSYITLRNPELVMPIHGFYTCISWFYIIYFEAGQTSVKFLSERANALGLDPSGHLARHKNLVHAFRTCLQHTLYLQNRDDLAKRQRCEDWIQDQLGTLGRGDSGLWPETSQQWRTLLSALLQGAVQFMKIIESTVRVILEDESSEETIRIWISRIRRQYPAHEWDRIATEVVSDMGLEFLDTETLRRRYLEKWNQRLSVMKDDCDFSIEARKLIEQTLLNEERIPLPITGRDIMVEFGIPPGPQVKELLDLAQKLFLEEPRDRVALLSALGETYGKKGRPQQFPESDKTL